MIRTGRNSTLRVIGLGFVVGLLTVWLTGFGPGETWEEASIDWRMRLRPLAPPSGSVACLTISDKDLQIEEKGTWPLSRYIHADVIRILQASGAGHISFDIFFSEPGDQNHDTALIEAVEESGSRVTIPYFFSELVEEGNSETIQRQDVENPFSLFPAEGSKFGLNPVDTDALVGVGPVPPFSDRLCKNLGFVNVKPEAGEAIVRRIPLLVRHQDRLYPGLAFQTVLSHLNLKSDEIQVVPGRAIKLFPENHPEITIPIDHHLQYRVNYTSLSANFGDTLTYSDLYLAVDDSRQAEKVKDRVKNRPALIGLISTGSSDVVNTPIGRLPGMLAQTTAIENILDGNHARFLPNLASWVGSGFFGALIAFLLLRCKTWTVLIVAAICGSAVIFPAILAARSNWFIPVTAPLLSISFWMVASLTAASIKSLAERNFVEKALGRYISPNVARLALMQAKSNQHQETKRREITVFFSDIRGFTDWSERNEPEEVTSVLNDYLAAMIPLIQEHGGTLDKFIGDSVMVLLNESGDLEDHPAAAVRMAVAMQKKTQELANALVDIGRESIEIGVGIHTGFATVGNFGSEDYLDFTAIGTTVNLAARLEGISEAGQIYVSEVVYHRIKNEFELEFVGERELKGLSKPVGVYRVIFE